MVYLREVPHTGYVHVGIGRHERAVPLPVGIGPDLERVSGVDAGHLKRLQLRKQSGLAHTSTDQADVWLLLQPRQIERLGERTRRRNAQPLDAARPNGLERLHDRIPFGPNGRVDHQQPPASDESWKGGTTQEAVDKIERCIVGEGECYVFPLEPLTHRRKILLLERHATV